MNRRETLSRAPDKVMLAALVALLAIGLLAVYSATVGEADRLWQKQAVYAAIGFVFMAGL